MKRINNQSKLIRQINEEIERQKQTGKKEMMDSAFTRLVQVSTLNNIFNYFYEKDIARIEKQIVDTYTLEMGLKENSLRFLTTRDGFDRFSYAAFKAFHENFDRFSYTAYKACPGDIPIKDKTDVELKITERIGKDTYFWTGVKINGDYSLIPNSLQEVCNKFEKSGYYTKANVLTNLDNWSFDSKQLESTGETKLAYQMKDPVILPSAIQLRKEYDSNCQHISSRTMQAGLKTGKLNGHEINFDVKDHSADNVIEHWIIYKQN